MNRELRRSTIGILILIFGLLITACSHHAADTEEPKNYQPYNDFHDDVNTGKEIK